MVGGGARIRGRSEGRKKSGVLTAVERFILKTLGKEGCSMKIVAGAKA